MPILSSLAVACARAYGFTALTSGGFVTVIQSFTATGEWVCPTGVTEVEWLIVAGGGGGGGSVVSTWVASGGGAGGFRTGTGLAVTAGTTYTITVGAGGGGATGINVAGGSGGFSSIAGAPYI
jgi:MSHA biogenesis protein MshQ